MAFLLRHVSDEADVPRISCLVVRKARRRRREQHPGIALEHDEVDLDVVVRGALQHGACAEAIAEVVHATVVAHRAHHELRVGLVVATHGEAQQQLRDLHAVDGAAELRRDDEVGADAHPRQATEDAAKHRTGPRGKVRVLQVERDRWIHPAEGAHARALVPVEQRTDLVLAGEVVGVREGVAVELLEHDAPALVPAVVGAVQAVQFGVRRAARIEQLVRPGKGVGQGDPHDRRAGARGRKRRKVGVRRCDRGVDRGPRRFRGSWKKSENNDASRKIGLFWSAWLSVRRRRPRPPAPCRAGTRAAGSGGPACW